MTDLKYGRRNVAKMIREWDTLRQAIRAEGTPTIQEALDQVEEHIDYAYRADLAALEPQPDTRDEVIARLVEAAENLLRNYLQDELDEPDLCVNDDHWTAIHDVDAALAAAKAVQK